MALSPADADRLATLRAARDALLEGKRPIKTRDATGREVWYAGISVQELRNEIAALESQDTDASPPRRGALRLYVR